MGSKTDLKTMSEAAAALKKFKISYDLKILSAHRTPKEVAEFAQNARKKNFGVIIAGAGGAAHLPGMVAAYTDLPVIGVPVAVGVLEGFDALLSIVQMPKGIPVATVAIGGAWNAGVLAAQILGAQDSTGGLLKKVGTYKKEMHKKVKKFQISKK